jgi:dihydrofolate reductase
VECRARANAFAVVGFIVGLTRTSHGGGAVDIAYHVTVLPLLLLTVVILLRRRRDDATSEVCVPREVETMANLIYSAITSLDGYVADADGSFNWSAPDEEVHRFINDLERPVDMYLYGRRMYEVLSAWETMETAGEPPVIQEYAQIWRAAAKIVYSKTLGTTSSARTRIERDFDPDAVRELKASVKGDISVGGPTLAAQAIKAELVDELHLFVSPVVVGGGNPSLPDDVRLELELLNEHRFGNGVVHLHYRTTT